MIIIPDKPSIKTAQTSSDRSACRGSSRISLRPDAPLKIKAESKITVIVFLRDLLYLIIVTIYFITLKRAKRNNDLFVTRIFEMNGCFRIVSRSFHFHHFTQSRRSCSIICPARTPVTDTHHSKLPTVHYCFHSTALTFSGFSAHWGAIICAFGRARCSGRTTTEKSTRDGEAERV